MADRRYISLALDEIRRAVTEGTPGLLASRDLPPLNAVGGIFVGMTKNPPECWVMPAKTQFGEEGTFINQIHAVNVKVAVVAGEPELVVEAALRYVWAIDEAIRGWVNWDARVLRVFVREHDYGPVFEHASTFARFPELHLAVQMSEVWG